MREFLVNKHKSCYGYYKELPVKICEKEVERYKSNTLSLGPLTFIFAPNDSPSKTMKNVYFI